MSPGLQVLLWERRSDRPVVIYGHGSNRSNRDVLQAASVLASHGLAVIGPNATGCGFGPATTVRVGFADGTSATVPLAGRSFDQNGDGVIANREGDSATAPRTLQLNADAPLQTVADLTQLVRVLRAGVDIDGDGAADLDPSRIQVLATWAALRRDGQRQAVAFFAADGAELITPTELRVYWVPPASAPPDTFGYIQ